MPSLPEDILPFFVSAGWYEGRAVPLLKGLAEHFPADHPALSVLAEFGGLSVNSHWKRHAHSPEEITFLSSSSEYRPEWEDPEIPLWNKLLDTRLVCVANLNHGYGELHVAHDARCFGLSLVHEAFYFMGDTFADAMRYSMFGGKTRPLLRPDQEFVQMYGATFTRDSPQLYQY